MPLPASIACSICIAFSARRNSSPTRRCSTSKAAILLCIDRPMARQSAKCWRQCGLTEPLVSRAIDQSSHTQQIAMIDWGGKARIARAGSVLRELNTLTRMARLRSIKTRRTASFAWAVAHRPPRRRVAEYAKRSVASSTAPSPGSSAKRALF